jgi:hypothetical protein
MKSLAWRALVFLASPACAQTLEGNPPSDDPGRPPEACVEEGNPCDVNADCCSTQCSEMKVCEAAQEPLDPTMGRTPTSPDSPQPSE